ncbi:MAG: hypothetical protein IJG24_04455, partial [Selenomonadaceae bacterium]|nr:hypothetical protein [Selenomonadaceae bacterium]
DTIYNYGANSSISGDAGDDGISNNGSNVSIDGGAGNDGISNNGSNVSIDGGAGNDTIGNDGSNVSIGGGAGDDDIGNDGNDVSIAAGAGNDTIEDVGVNSTVNPGKGNDSVSFHDDYHKNNPRRVGAAYVYANGDGDDTVSGFDSTDTLVIADNYSSAISGMDVIFTVGNGHITLLGGASLSAVNVVSKLSETAPFNIVINTLSSAAFGNDSAANGKKIYGKDYTYKQVKNKNYIVNEGDDVIISLNGSKSGDDYIYNEGSDVTISAGKGDDTVYNTQDNVVFNYASGDGDDVIYGFTKANKIRLGDGTTAYTQKRVLDDIVLEVGKGSITIKDAASLDSIRVTGKKSSASTDNNLIYGTSHGDVYTNTLEGATINALGGSDSIQNDSANVSISGGDGADTIVNDDYGDKNLSNVVINGGAGDDSIDNYGESSTILGGAGNDTIYNRGWRREVANVSINGGAGNDYIDNNNGSQVTIDAGAGDDTISNNSDNVSINAGEGNDSICNDGSNNVTINAGKGDDSIDVKYGSLYDNLIQYASGDGNDIIYNFDSKTTLQITSGTVNKATTDGEN